MISLLLGTGIAWVFLPEPLLAREWVHPATGGISWYETLLEWLLWPGVSLMVAAALMSFAISLARMGWARLGRRSPQSAETGEDERYKPGGIWHFPRNWFVGGILLATLESVAPEKLRRYLPSASSLGFAFIIPPFISLALFLGAMARVAAERIRPRWSARYLIVIAAGLVAGESLAGILSALASFFG